MSELSRELRFRVHQRTFTILARIRDEMVRDGRRAKTGSGSGEHGVSVSDIARTLLVAYLEDPLGRLELPNRRVNVTVPVTFIFGGNENTWDVAFGTVDGVVRECFCSASETNKAGSDLQALLADACISISLLLQRKETIRSVAKAFGENRGEGQASGPPASLLGAVARAGVAVEESLR